MFFFVEDFGHEEENMAQMSFKEEEKLLDVICTVSRLKHPNIVAL